MVKKRLVEEVSANSSVVMEFPTSAKQIRIESIEVNPEKEMCFDLVCGPYICQAVRSLKETESFELRPLNKMIVLELFNNSQEKNKFQLDIEYSKIL